MVRKRNIFKETGVHLIMKKHIWTSKQTSSAKVPNYGKLYVMKPAILKLIGDVKGKKVLELGCGNGFWLKLLDSKGAKCIGVDKSKNQIDLATRESKGNNPRYYTGDISNLKMFSNNSFDRILIEHVILEIPNINKIRKILREAYRVAKWGGKIVISDLHPFAPSLSFPNLKPEKDYYYFNSGSLVQIISKRVDGKETFYTDYHWTLEDISNAITDSGFKITKVLEPRPSEETIRKYPYLKYRRKDPLALIIEAQK